MSNRGYIDTAVTCAQTNPVLPLSVYLTLTDQYSNPDARDSPQIVHQPFHMALISLRIRKVLSGQPGDSHLPPGVSASAPEHAGATAVWEGEPSGRDDERCSPHPRLTSAARPQPHEIYKRYTNTVVSSWPTGSGPRLMRSTPGRKQYSAGKPPSPGMCKLQATPRESAMSPKASTHPNASPSALS